MALPLILLALCLVELLLGKKLLAVQRFIACAVVGYCAGVLAISPLINKIFALPEYISGIVLAIVAAVLSKYIYHAAVAITCGYSAFVLFYTDSVIKGSFPTQNNLVICIIIGLAFALLVCVLHRFAGMLITSLIGSYLITRVVISFFYDYRALAFLNGNGWIMTLIIVVVLSTVGFIVQYKTRTRY